MKPKLFEQNEAKRLRIRGFSVKEITKKLKVSKSSVSVWVRGIPLGKSQKQRLIKRELWGGAKGRKKIAQLWRTYRLLNPKPVKKPRWPKRSVENFLDIWTPEMAYVLGYFAADGHMFKNKNGSCYMAFTSADQELLISVKEILGVANSIGSHIFSNKKWKTKYVLQIGSKRIYERLLKLGFTPNKSLTLSFPDIPDNVVSHFIRGYFDGDGCASFAKRIRKNRKNVFKDLRIRFTCGSKPFLISIQNKLMLNAGTGAGGLYKKKGNCYDLVYSNRNVVKLYRFMYSNPGLPFLKRKWQILNQGIKSWDRSSVRLERLPVEMQLLKETLG